MSKKTLRIILSPFIFIYGLLISIAITCFPYCVISMYHFMLIIGYPLMWLISKSTNDWKFPEPFEERTPNLFLNYVISAFVPVIIPFYVTIVFINQGKLITRE